MAGKLDSSESHGEQPQPHQGGACSALTEVRLCNHNIRSVVFSKFSWQRGILEARVHLACRHNSPGPGLRADEVGQAESTPDCKQQE